MLLERCGEPTIGQLWPLQPSPMYEHLLKQDVNTLSSVPRAWHCAVLDLKAKHGNSDNISFWAPFIHLGP